MSSALFDVKIVSVSGPQVVLDLKPHQDARILAEKSFALMLIEEEATEKDPIARMNCDTGSMAWTRKFANGYIKSIVVKKRRVTITAHRPAWTQHLRKGQTWGSTSFASSQGGYAPCRPIDPPPPLVEKPKKEQKSPPTKLYPRAYWPSPDAPVGSVLGPRWDWCGYEVGATLKKPDVKELVGRMVQIGKHRGVLSIAGTNYVLHHIGVQYVPEMYTAPISSIKRAVLLEVVEKQCEIGYDRIFGWLPTRVVKVTRKGAVAKLELTCSHDGYLTHLVKNLGDVLTIIWSPLIVNNKWIKSTAPLSAEVRKMHDFPDGAKRYIKSYELKPAAKKKVGKLDDAKANALFAKPVPRATLEIVATDPKWLDHVKAPYQVW